MNHRVVHRAGLERHSIQEWQQNQSIQRLHTCGSYHQCSSGDFNNFRKFLFVAVHIVAHPLTITEEIVILFCTIREQILTKVSIKARRAIFTTIGIIICTILSFLTRTEYFISPSTTHVTTINQFRCFLIRIVVGLQNTTQPGFI
jgi:hypothetical protein